MRFYLRHLHIWKFETKKEKAYQEFTRPINLVSLRVINILIFIGMSGFIFVDIFRDVNYGFVITARLLLMLIAFSILFFSWLKRLSAIQIDRLIVIALMSLAIFAFLTSYFGNMPFFFLVNISITIMVFTATISGLRFRHSTMFNLLYLICFIFYSQHIQRNDFYFSQYSNLISMSIYSAIAGLLIEIRRRQNFLQYESLQVQKKKVETLDGQKNKIISLLSHDVASPLNSLHSLLELKSKGHVSDEDFLPFLDQVKNQLGNVSTLVHGLVRWSRSQIDGFVPDKKETDLIKLIQETIKFFQQSAQEKSIKIKFHIQQSVKVFVDEDMIRIALRNLISNAVKFSKINSEIKIEINVSNKVMIKVSNEGSKITDELKQKLFGQQVPSTPGTTGEKGTGLGLILVTQFVKLNDGEIYLADSEENSDHNTFCISLPKK